MFWPMLLMDTPAPTEPATVVLAPDEAFAKAKEKPPASEYTFVLSVADRDTSPPLANTPLPPLLPLM